MASYLPPPSLGSVYGPHLASRAYNSEPAETVDISLNDRVPVLTDLSNKSRTRSTLFRRAGTLITENPVKTGLALAGLIYLARDQGACIVNNPLKIGIALAGSLYLTRDHLSNLFSSDSVDPSHSSHGGV